MSYSLSRLLIAALIVLVVIATAADMPRCRFTAGGLQSSLTAPAASNQRLTDNYRNLPLSFEAASEGPRIDFVSCGDGYVLTLNGAEAALRLQSSELRMKFVNANPKLRGEGVDLLPGKSNYIIGADPRRWRTNVANFARVRYREVWPGIDLIYYGNGRQLEYDLIVAPGASPDDIRLKFSGATQLSIDASGDLALLRANGEVRLRKPVIYQEVNGKRNTIEGRYTIHNPGAPIRSREIGFKIRDYDRAQPLVIDPVLSYSALIDSEFINAIAVDTDGAVYFTGLARSAAFPISPGAYRSVRGEFNRSAAFIAKLNSAGTALVYSTYFGGFEAFDYPYGIAVDSGGNAYVAGIAGSSDFPTTPGALQPTFAGPGQVGNTFSGDGFVLKLNPMGTGLVYSTFLGGLGSDYANDIAVDGTGNAYITGDTTSSNFPISPDAPQRSIAILRLAIADQLPDPGGRGHRLRNRHGHLSRQTGSDRDDPDSLSHSGTLLGQRRWRRTAGRCAIARQSRRIAKLRAGGRIRPGAEKVRSPAD